VSDFIFVRNRQATRKIDTSCLQTILSKLIEDELDVREYEIGVLLVARPEMAKINQTYLHHKGSTDVITFDYGDSKLPNWLAGDIFICIQEAVNQARTFGTTWQAEAVRYLVHGVLHLCGYDDQGPRQRKRMKQEEDRIVTKFSRQFDFNKLSKTARISTRKGNPGSKRQR